MKMDSQIQQIQITIDIKVILIMETGNKHKIKCTQVNKHKIKKIYGKQIKLELK